jgi:hypothetical protein
MDQNSGSLMKIPKLRYWDIGPGESPAVFDPTAVSDHVGSVPLTSNGLA